MFFSSAVIKWNSLDSTIRNAGSYNAFKNILKYLRPSPNSAYGCYNSKGINFVTQPCQGLSHLGEHKFKHSFQDTLNPLCQRGHSLESTSRFLLYCPSFKTERKILRSILNDIDQKLLKNIYPTLTNIL